MPSPELSTPRKFWRSTQEYTLQSSTTAQAEASYLRSEEIARAYGTFHDDIMPEHPLTIRVALCIDDISKLNTRFWDMHADPILCIDGAATILLTIQYNLVIGMLARVVEDHDRQDLLPLLQKLLHFDVMLV